MVNERIRGIVSKSKEMRVKLGGGKSQNTNYALSAKI